MDSTNEILFLGVGVVIGILIGGLIAFLIKGRRQFPQSDNSAKQEFEKERIRLETELKNAGKTIDEKNSVISDKNQQFSELNLRHNETAKELSAAKTQVQTLGEIYEKLNEKAERQENELNNARAEIAHFTASAKALEKKIDELREQNNLKEIQNHELTELWTNVKNENAALQANLQASEEKLLTQKAEIEDIRQKSHLEFENIANRLMEAKTEKFTETNKINIQKLLEPLGKEIDSFRAKVEETYDKEAKERFSLGEKVKELIETTDKVSAEANNLATALKGQAKTQGNWGEMILERILETNGLVRGREYDVQHPIKNSEGDQQFLDVIVHLPDNRKLIIDSKVTLVAYDRYCASDTEEERERYLREHLKALSTHIDQLSSKKYDDMENSPDFVMLFVPVEPAYLTAVQYDSEIWSRAYSKRILLISPTNLMGAVKMVADLWKRDRQSKNAMEIANQGNKLYEKFVGFLTSMEDIGNHISKTQDAYNKALGQLKQGRGNLIRQAEKLKELGLKSQKQLPPSMRNYDDENDGETSDIFELEII